MVDRQVADKQVYQYNKLKKGKGRPPAKQKVLMQKLIETSLFCCLFRALKAVRSVNPRQQLRQRQLRDIRTGELSVMAAQFEHTSSEDNSDTEPFSDMEEAYRELSKRFMVK